jgi:hypothetical protein
VSACHGSWPLFEKSTICVRLGCGQFGEWAALEVDIPVSPSPSTFVKNTDPVQIAMAVRSEDSGSGSIPSVTLIAIDIGHCRVIP